MKLLVIGAGVIGTIYGYALAQAGNDVTHYVRPGKKQQFAHGLDITLLDGRNKHPRNEKVHYAIKVTETVETENDYELIIVSVRHYQMESVLPLVKQLSKNAEVLFFNGLWDTPKIIEPYLPASKYLWGFPVAGGGYGPDGLDAALLDEVRIGSMEGQPTERLSRIAALFEGAGLKVDVQKNMLHWLWVHFAINCGIIGAAFKAGSSQKLLNSVKNLRLGILAGKEALQVCEARGVDTHAYEDAKSFYAPAGLGAILVWLMMKNNLPARKIMESHTAVDELQKMYFDLQKSADEAGIQMPVYSSLQSYVINPKLNLK